MTMRVPPRDLTSEETIRAFFTEVKQAVRTAEVRGILRLCAQRKEVIVYLDVAKALGMFSGGTELATCLGLIMTDNAAKGEPLVSSLVIRSDTGRPGRGYFEHARRLGLLSGTSAADEEAFWQSQMRLLGVDPSIADDGDYHEAPPTKPASTSRVGESGLRPIEPIVGGRGNPSRVSDSKVRIPVPRQ